MVYALAAPAVLWSVIYALSNAWMSLLGPQDLKKKYGAKWALVTGMILL